MEQLPDFVSLNGTALTTSANRLTSIGWPRAGTPSNRWGPSTSTIPSCGRG